MLVFISLNIALFVRQFIGTCPQSLRSRCDCMKILDIMYPSNWLLIYRSTYTVLGYNSPWRFKWYSDTMHVVTLETNCVYAFFSWARVTHICVSKLTIIGSENGLSPDRFQAIIWASDGMFLIGALGTDFGEVLIHLLSIKCFWKCRQKTCGHFVSASMC